MRYLESSLVEWCLMGAKGRRDRELFNGKSFIFARGKELWRLIVVIVAQ